MKVRTNKKVKIDWTILATTETPEDRNNLLVEQMVKFSSDSMFVNTLLQMVM